MTTSALSAGQLLSLAKLATFLQSWVSGLVVNEAQVKYGMRLSPVLLISWCPSEAEHFPCVFASNSFFFWVFFVLTQGQFY